MRADWFAAILLAMGGGALCVGVVMGSLWPGVTLAGLSLVPWAWGEWMGRIASTETAEQAGERRRLDSAVSLLNEAHRMASDAHARIEKHEATMGMMVDAAMSTKAAHERIGRLQDEVNSLRNAVSLRGTLGG